MPMTLMQYPGRHMDVLLAFKLRRVCTGVLVKMYVVLQFFTISQFCLISNRNLI